MTYIPITAVCLLLLFASNRASAQKCNECDSIQHKHYSTHFFLQSDIHLKKYEWNNGDLNCRINKAQKHHTKFIGFIAGTGVSLAIGTGLIASSLAWAIPHREQDYKVGYTLVFSGIGACVVAVPLFVLADIHNHKAKKALKNLKSF